LLADRELLRTRLRTSEAARFAARVGDAKGVIPMRYSTLGFLKEANFPVRYVVADAGLKMAVTFNFSVTVAAHCRDFILQ
jgi:hypothetical protein